MADSRPLNPARAGNVEFEETKPDESKVKSSTKKFMDTAAEILQASVRSLDTSL